MNKLISYLAIITLFFTVACSSSSNLKWKPLSKRDLEKYSPFLDSVVAYNKAMESLATSTRVRFYGLDSLPNSNVIIDSGEIYLPYANLNPYFNPRIDTSDVIITHIIDWEAPIISIITGKMVHPRLTYGFYGNYEGTAFDSKLFKVKDGVWIPIEWPKDIVNLYIRPKK